MKMFEMKKNRKASSGNKMLPRMPMILVYVGGIESFK